MNSFFRYILLVSIIVFQSCTTGTQYLKADKDKGGREWGPMEIKATVKTMVSSLYETLKSSQKEVYLDVAKIKNISSEHIDTSILANEIVTNLIKKRIKFLDRSRRSESLKEIQLGQSGMIDESSAIPAGKLKSPNYILSGDVNDNVVYRSGNRVQYLVITLKLTSVSTNELVWQEQQEFLKATPEHRYSF